MKIVAIRFVKTGRVHQHEDVAIRFVKTGRVHHDLKIVAVRFVKTGRVHQHEDSSRTFRKDRKSSPTRLLNDAAQSARSSRSP